MYRSNSDKIKFLPELILFAIFGFIQLSHINLDFWNDEIYSIKNFILTSPIDTVSDYHSPNNHILFNLINNLYLKVVGIDSLFDVFDRPWILRIVPFIFSIITVLFTYKIGRKFVSRTTGLLACVILISSVPFYNFSLQIRGYGLSMMLGAILIYHLLSYLDSKKQKNIVIVFISAALMFYTIPSNLYFLISVILTLFFLLLINQKARSSFFTNNYAFCIYAILIGILLTLLFYVPILSEVFSNEHVKFRGGFSLLEFNSKVVYAAYGLMYNRWFIIGLAILGIAIARKSLKKDLTLISIGFAVIVIPLMIVWITGQRALPRTFTISLPFVAVLLSVLIFRGWNTVFSSNSRDLILVIGISFLTISSFYFQLNRVEQQMLYDIRNGTRTQSLHYQYYTARYWPLQRTGQLKESYSDRKLPIVVEGYETHGFFNYLDKFELPYHSFENIETTLSMHDTIYLVTHHPYNFIGRDDLDVKLISIELSYHNLLLVTKK